MECGRLLVQHDDLGSVQPAIAVILVAGRQLDLAIDHLVEAAQHSCLIEIGADEGVAVRQSLRRDRIDEVERQLDAGIRREEPALLTGLVYHSPPALLDFILLPSICRSPLLPGMNHDFHGVVALVERIWEAALLQVDAADADLAVDDGECNRLQALVLTGTVDAQPGLDLEYRAVPAAFQKGPVSREETALAEIEPDALVRTGIDIAE